MTDNIRRPVLVAVSSGWLPEIDPTLRETFLASSRVTIASRSATDLPCDILVQSPLAVGLLAWSEPSSVARRRRGVVKYGQVRTILPLLPKWAAPTGRMFKTIIGWSSRQRSGSLTTIRWRCSSGAPWGARVRPLRGQAEAHFSCGGVQ
jgi:hypothetical protein